MEYNDYIDIQKIKDFITLKKLSISNFCKKCDINYSTYKAIMNNNQKVRASAIFKIAKIMGVEAHSLLKEKLF